MRFIETKKLNDYIVAAGTFFTDDLGKSLAGRLATLKSISLQEVSLESDRAFLSEVSSVLNVIASIIYHPHLSNRREEVVLRIELAQHLSREDFWDTARDSKLWKEHHGRMIPEEVYYHQHIDELRIYENRFVGFLVDLIDRELLRYSSFYLGRLPTLSTPDAALDASEVGELIVTIDRLRRKTQFIKNTFFYREVSKGKPISPQIVPTNILLKDRLYRYCFRFYRAFARYEDRETATRDLSRYYTVLFLSELLERGFAVKESRAERHALENASYGVSLVTEENGDLSVTVTPKDFSAAPARHRIVFLTEGGLPVEPREGYDSTDTLSPWELSSADPEGPFLTRTAPERELCRAWLEDRLARITANPGVYQKYCPVCGHRSVENRKNGQIYHCTDCHSVFCFDAGKSEGNVWFHRIRKKGIS